MQRIVGMMLLLAGASTFAMGAFTVPEIGASSAGSAVALLSGTLLIIRGRGKK
jgi:hypothetical protein